jgi:hypothetical protein
MFERDYRFWGHALWIRMTLVLITLTICVPLMLALALILTCLGAAWFLLRVPWLLVKTFLASLARMVINTFWFARKMIKENF